MIKLKQKKKKLKKLLNKINNNKFKYNKTGNNILLIFNNKLHNKIKCSNNKLAT